MNGRRTKILIFSLLIITSPGRAQSFEWWRDNVGWDGTTHWWKYMTVSPKFFGPNALAVPAMNNGSADTAVSLGVSGAFHFMKGDKTQNLILYGSYTTPSNTISLDAHFIPHERFQVSHDLKTERKVYYEDYNRTSTTGDVVVNTVFQVFKKWRPRLQLAMRVGVRMPSGGGLGAARYADVPAYWIDAGAGIPVGKSHWKWNHMMGFLVWQTNEDHLRQNDAFLFGTGAEFNKNGWKVQLYGAGYIGYKDNGDKPIVVRANLEKAKDRIAYFFRLQQGLHDFEYLSIESGGRVLFK